MEFGWFHNVERAFCSPTREDESKKEDTASNESKSFLRHFPAVINYRRVIIKRPPSFLRRTFYGSLKGMYPSCTCEKLDLSRPFASRSPEQEGATRRYRDPIFSQSPSAAPHFLRSELLPGPVRACPFKRQKDNGISRPGTSSRPCTSRLQRVRTLTLQFVSPFPHGGWLRGLATWKCCLEKRAYSRQFNKIQLDSVY